MEEQLLFPWCRIDEGTTTEGSLTFEQQLAQAQALIANGKRIEELTTKRTQLTADLAAVDEELATILGPATSTNGNGRAKQTCKFILPEATVCGSEEHNARSHNQ